MDTIPYFSNVWKTISGKGEDATVESVNELLALTKDYLRDGILKFKPFTEESYQQCLKLVEISPTSEFGHFIHRISGSLNLDCLMLWPIFCNYLMFEFYGRIEDVEKLLLDSTSAEEFIKDLWNFYVLERIFVIKIIRYILEEHVNTSNKFHNEYKRYIKSITYKVLLESLLKQYEELIKDVFESTHYTRPKDFAKRNLREQLHVLFSILTGMKFHSLAITDTLKLMRLFKKHHFERLSINFQTIVLEQPNIIQEMTAIKSAIILASFENLWTSSNVWNSHRNEIERLVRFSQKNDNHSALSLFWTTLQFMEADDYLKRELVERIIDSLNADALVYLYNLVSSDILKDSMAGSVLQSSILKLMDILCIKFGGDKIYIQEGAVLLIGELFRTLNLATSCLCGQSPGVKSLYVNAMSLFPHHFQSLTLFMESLVGLNFNTQIIIDELTHLTIYSKLYSTCLPHLIVDNRLNYPYKPLNNNLVVFPVGTKVTNLDSSEQRLLQFHGSYSYFTLLQHVVMQYCEEIENNLKCEENTSNMLRYGYGLLLQILKVDWRLVKSNAAVEELIMLATSHLLSASMKATVKDLEILRLLFEICVHVFKHNPETVITNLHQMMFLPRFVSCDFTKELFAAPTFLSSFTLLDLFEEEYALFQSSEFLQLYLQLIKRAFKCNSFLKRVQIPGLMYIMQRVFPGVIESSLSHINKQKILVEVVQILYFNFRKNRDLLVDEELVLHDGCLELILKDKIYLTHLLDILNCDSQLLQSRLAFEINFHKNESLNLALIIKCSLYCLWHLLSYIQSHKSIEEYSYLESELFCRSVSQISILKVIFGYMNNYYDSDVSVIVCNILTAYANLSNNHLLFCLTLDNYQVQSMFVERLRDSEERTDMQISVLKFIRACVDKQVSMTNAFFCEDDADCNFFGVLKEFLTNIEENPNILMSPVQQEILNLLHELFVKNKQHIMKRIVTVENFWVILVSMLFKMTNVNIDIYLKLFEIITIELHIEENKNDELTKAFTILFEPKNKFFDIWMKQLIILLENKHTILIASVALTVWKKLLRTISQFYKNTFIESWNKSLLGEKCLQALYVYSKFPNDFDVLIDCIELCLLFPCNIEKKSGIQDVHTVKWLSDTLSNLIWSYQFLSSYCKTAILTIAARAFKNYRECSIDLLNLGPAFLKSLLEIFTHEYEKVSIEERMNECKNDEDYYSWFLTIDLINNLLLEPEISQYGTWFTDANYLEKMLNFVSHCVYQPVPLKVVEVSALSITIYAENILSDNFEELDLKTIYLETTAPTNYTRESNPDAPVPRNFQNFLIIFSYLIRQNQFFLIKDKKNASEVLKFIYIHQIIIVDVLSLATVQANIWHLKLVVKILHFLYDALRYHAEWNMEDPISFTNILISIKQVLNSSIGVILRPKILVFTQDKPNLSKIIVKTDVPERHFINTCDVFIEIITWSCMFFTRCNPSFINLLDMYKPLNFNILIESDFRVPPAVNYETKTLAYGGLLCVLRFFCKSLSQISSEEQKGEIEELIKTSETSVDFQSYHTLIHPTNIKETAETINALYRFGIPEMLELPAPWFLKLNSDNLWLGVEAIITLLAGQAFLTINDSSVERTIQRYIRRELCAELRFFYDVIDKIVTEKYVNKIDKAFGMHKSTNVIEPQWAELNKLCQLIINRSPSPVKISDMDDCYLLVVVHWFKNVCGFVLNSTFDEFISNWHAKSTWVNEGNSYVKNTTVNLSDDDD